jgi:hypothetical protein
MGERKGEEECLQQDLSCRSLVLSIEIKEEGLTEAVN